MGTNLFAGSAGGGVFLSTNNGTNWSAVNSGLTQLSVNSLATLGTYIYAGTSGGGIFISTNNGLNWNTVNTGLTNLYVFSLKTIGTNIFAATYGGGVFLSTNNGTSWNTVNSGLTNLNARALAVSGNNLFVGTGYGGVFLSTNNGTTWNSVSTGLANVYIRTLSVSGTNLFLGSYGNGVYKRPLSEMITDVKQDGVIPSKFSLEQNYPNPFNPSTVISYQVAPINFPKGETSVHVTLKVYDVLGREIKTLVDEFQEAGKYNSQFSILHLPAGRQGSELSSGTYFYTLRAGDYVFTRKMLLIK